MYLGAVFTDQVYSFSLNHIPVPCFVLSEKMCLKDLNSAFLEFIGSSDDQLIGMRLDKLLSVESMTLLKTRVNSELNNRLNCTFIAKGENKQAICDLQPVERTKNTIWILTPKPEKPKQHKLNADNYFQDILSNSSTWFWHIRADHTICELSENFEHLTGLNPEKVLNESIFDYLELTKEVQSEKNLKCFFNKPKSFQGLISSFKCTPTRGFIVTTNAQPYYDEKGEFSGFIGCTQDISEEFTAKKELQVALKKLENSNENLEQFAIMASHDLQEPARLIHSYVQLIAQDGTNQLSDKSTEFFGFLKESSDRMRSLIHNILDYSNLRNEGQEKEWFSSSEIISLSKLSCTKIIHESGAIIENVVLPEKIFCCPNQLTRVFQNLFSNSIKFTRPFETPIIEIKSIERADHVEIHVSDNGIGIAQEDRSTVFKMFTSLHSKSKYKGNGIGMSIVKKIIESHEGKVIIGNSHLGGTTVVITLPLPS